jgi:hypothetical protein
MYRNNIFINISSSQNVYLIHTLLYTKLLFGLRAISLNVSLRL